MAQPVMMEVDSLNISESTLFSQQPEDEFTMSDSLLFTDDKLEEPDLEMAEPEVQPPIPEVAMDEVEVGSDPGKEVKLFNGRTVKLYRKPKQTYDVDLQVGSYFNSNLLFSKANLRNTIKENNEKLASVTTKSKPSSGQIWSEKYRPNKFIQLCSGGNDKQYRLVLHWLKKWSSIVFGENSGAGATPGEDSLGRPYRKILLIHGPPGIGKTSLVHILAKQMGYTIQELNAANSMDLLPQSDTSHVTSALKLKINNALTVNSLKSNKPTCLVIDEIDSLGNLHDVVKVLHDVITSDQRAMKKENTGKKKKDVLLTRPIICIANEVYPTGNARAMDKLRPICEIIPFRKPQGSNGKKSIKDHLTWISECEKLQLSSREINDVVNVCDGDIRACINHIQFNSNSVDSMDKQISWFNMVDQLFVRDASLKKDENFMVLLDKYSNGRVVNNSFDKVVMGSFNRYLDTVHLQDDSLKRPCEFSDWLGFYDLISTNPEYTGFVGLKIWSLFSQINPAKTTNQLIPNVRNLEYETYETLKQNKAVIKRVWDNIPINCQLSLNSQAMTEYFLPYMSKILTPNISSNLTDVEKGWIKKITAIIKQFNLKLENSRDLETGVVTLQLTPNWDPITTFTKSQQVQIKRKMLFPLISAELERLTIKKRPQEVTQEPTKKKLKTGNSVDFFRGKYQDMNTQMAVKDDDGFKPARVWVKYHEGFSNAVRKNIGWKDIWLP
ncbi:Chromosome transmission fidelity protein 18 [Spathaspora sp. JA1]|nr:Chromosome transmission fidelity protein 18 [Spathaspora sp. JA1]